MQSCIKALVDKINTVSSHTSNSELNKNGLPIVNLYQLVQSTSLDIIGETAFGGSFNLVEKGDHPLPGKVFQELKRRVLYHTFPFMRPFLKKDSWIDEFIQNIIKERRNLNAQGKTREDILQILLDARDEDNYLIVLAGSAEDPRLLVFETPQAQVHIMRGEMEAPGTILDALRAKGYEDFVTMLEEAGLAETLTGDGPYTLFVPADFLIDELVASGEDLNNYIVEGDIRSSDVTLSEGELTTLGGLSYQLGVNNDGLAIGNASIIDVNIEATNGTIHIINDLLTSPNFSDAEATPEATEAADG